jgi:hypothetical protein
MIMGADMGATEVRSYQWLNRKGRFDLLDAPTRSLALCCQLKSA